MTRIAIISDTHDHIPNLQIALTQIRASGAGMLLHCGDLCAPFMVRALAEGFSGPVHIVFGNNDGDGRLLQKQAANYQHVNLHDVYAEVIFGGRSIGLIHYPEPARRIAQSDQLDLVCYGHNHLQNWEQLGRTFLVNPGEIMGMHGAPSWGLYDCERHAFKFKSLESG